MEKSKIIHMTTGSHHENTVFLALHQAHPGDQEVGQAFWCHRVAGAQPRDTE